MKTYYNLLFKRILLQYSKIVKKAYIGNISKFNT